MNDSFIKLNLLNSKSLDDIKRFSALVWPDDRTEGYITDFFGHDDILHSDKWRYPHFNYTINSYGCRGDELPIMTDLAAFGCSFTFGSGLPDYMIWHDVLAKKLNATCVNFGQPACSIESIVDIFLIVSKHIKIKKAIFLLPNISRLQLAKKHPDYDLISHVNIMPGYVSPINELFGVEPDKIYRALPEEEIYKICKNQLYLLEHIAKERGIQLYISSWEEETYNFVKQLDLESIVLPLWASPSFEFLKFDLARDLKHPGPQHHILFVDKIIDYIK